MGAKNLLQPILGLLLLVNLITAEDFSFEFGQRKRDDFIFYTDSGVLSKDHPGSIPAKPGVELTYVKLTLSLHSPTNDVSVNFDWETARFDIRFSYFTPEPIEYKLEARGVLVVPIHVNLTKTRN